jgi:hypothetical protein
MKNVNINFRRRHRTILASGVTAAAALAMVGASLASSGAAFADTVPNGPDVALTQYAIPTTAAAGVTGGDALPTIPGTLGNPTQLFMSQTYTTTQALGIPGDSSAWGTQVSTETATGGPGEIWRFQLVGSIKVTTQTSTGLLQFAFPANLLQTLPVYKIINYHSDGTHTCLDGYGNSPTAGSVIDSYGCDPNQANQTNQLWVIGNTMQGRTLDNQDGTAYETPYGSMTAPAWMSSALQANPLPDEDGTPNSVIENVAALQASGWNTTQAPILSSGVTNVQGINSATDLLGQGVFPTNIGNSTWLIHDTTMSSAGAGNSSSSGPNKANCTMYECLATPTGQG